ncbi:transposase [Myxococcus stipitatus]|uniref:transposase n=1 Tax=Myxococcus stipitatus TaxID=83455 RepID=UPI0030CC281C
MRRHELRDAQWHRIKPVLGFRSSPASRREDLDFINAVVWRVKIRVQWRDLPERFGIWKTVYNRFYSWARTGRWEVIFKELRLKVDEVGSLTESSVVWAHQDASGGKGATPLPRMPVLRVEADYVGRVPAHGHEGTFPREFWLTILPH